LKFRRNPLLAFVFTKVLDNKGFNVTDLKKPLSRGVNGEPPKIAGDPTAIELFGCCGGCARAAKTV